VNVELDEAFGTFVGGTVPFGASIALVLPESVLHTGREALTQLLRIGYERVEGYLAGGIQAWRSTGRAAQSYPVADVDDLRRAHASGERPFILDVRQPQEWTMGVIPGSVQLFVGDLPGRLDELPKHEEVWTICASGHRAAIAASLVARAGIRVRLVAREGVGRWLTEDAEGRCGTSPLLAEAGHRSM
jgi:hydroxyacylglutathione hydrolase